MPWSGVDTRLHKGINGAITLEHLIMERYDLGKSARYL